MVKGKYLHRSAYVDAALMVIAEDGVEKLSMRKVASQLDVSPMAMYKHFSNKQRLLEAALDEFVARADVIPDDELPWDQWVEQMSRNMYQALCSERSWVQVLGSIRIGSHALRVTDAFVEKLMNAGFSAEQAVNAFFANVHLLIGAICIGSSLVHRNAAQEDIDTIPQLTALNRDPGKARRRDRVAAFANALSGPQINIGLPILLEALRAQIRDEPHAAPGT